MFIVTIRESPDFQTRVACLFVYVWCFVRLRSAFRGRLRTSAGKFDISRKFLESAPGLPTHLSNPQLSFIYCKIACSPGPDRSIGYIDLGQRLAL